MRYEFTLPDLGEGLTEGEVACWLVTEGQEVMEDDPLVEIQTDKTTVEIPSPASGTVLQIVVAEGEVVPVGTVLVVIGDGATAMKVEASEGAAAVAIEGPAGSAAGAAAETKRVQATPLVRGIARELSVDLEAIAPTGPGGRVTAEDVRAAAARKSEGAFVSASAEGRREPLRGVRRLIAEHMALAHREIPPVTWVEECDFGVLDELRGESSYVPFVLKAVALALRDYPMLNARLEADQILYLDRYDLGLAVQTDRGLVVPVVRECHVRTVEEISADVGQLANDARAGILAPEKLRGSTFTVTSAGKLAGLLQTPIINHPEVAILSVGRVAPRAVVRNGEIVARPIGTLAVTFDHRVIDGASAAMFGLSVIKHLEGDHW
jgi:pyruvate dehydrogenase E2 component (dihydrolipoamide acetyltransferase)